MLINCAKIQRAGLCLAALCLLAPAARGQATGTILGTVADSSSAVVVGARVAVTNVNTNVTRDVVTNGSGYYQVDNLIPGQYTVSAEMAGFKKAVRAAFELQVAQSARVDLTMEVGEVSQTVEITAAAPLVNTTDATVGQVVGVRETRELPLNGRNYLQLAALVPGTSQYGNQSFYNSGLTDNQGSVISGGSGEDRNEVSLDGVGVKSYMINVAFVPSIDGLREFKVETDPYSAELGRSAGAQIRLESKSGTNQFHGSLFEFLRNSNLDAKNYFDRKDRPIPPFKQNQFGGSLGGPIRRNKVFFFGDYEGFRSRKGQTIFGTVPTPLMKQGVFTEEGINIYDPLTTRPNPANPSQTIRDPFPNNTVPGARFNAVAAYFAQNLYPNPTGPGVLSNYATSAKDTTQRDQFNTRVDYIASEKDTIFGRFSFNDSTLYQARGIFNQGALPGFGDHFISNTRNLVLSDVHSFNPTTILEGKASYYRNYPSLTPEQLGNAVNEKFGVQGVRANEPLNPSVTGFNNPASNPFAPEFFAANQYQYVVSLTKVLNNHTLKAGAEYNRLQLFEVAPRYPQGGYNFTGAFTGDPLQPLGSTGRPFADFLLGFPVSGQTIRGDTAGQLFRNLFHWYFTDTWRVTQNLSLNLGVRYEFTGNPYDKYDRISNFDPTRGLLIAGKNGVNRSTINSDLDNFAPRVGFNYHIPGSKMSIRGGYGIFYDILQMNVFNAVRANIPFTEFRNFNIDNPIAKVPNTPIQQVFGEGGGTPPLPTLSIFDTNLQQGYIQRASLNIERQFAGDFVLDVGYAREKKTRMVAGRELNAPREHGTYIRPYPQYVSLGQNTNLQDGVYNALLVKLEKRFSKGLSFLASYTLAKALDNISSGTGGIGAPGDAGFQDPYCFSCNRGRSTSDNRQRFVYSTVYELPQLRHATPLLRETVGGWQISGIFTAQSGFPFTPGISGDNALTGTGGQRPDRLLGVDPFGPGTRDPAHWFNPKAFVVAPRGFFGNSGRGILDGPGLMNLDIGLMKNFPITEALRLQFRSEFFNLTNHPNFGPPNATVNTPAAGIISSTVNDSREIQFALRLDF
ncbi:MAG TPA: carboxypeptidase-like regulatory domain-containing protein [Bryobacteraceae bacterium]|nr:carboxypeptidase-like regulatory domain-containing protein [Bryobacteraceae bacterium]